MHVMPRRWRWPLAVFAALLLPLAPRADAASPAPDALAADAPPPPSLEVQHVHEMGPWFGLRAVEVAVDGQRKGLLPGRPDLAHGTVLDVARLGVTPGRHEVEVLVLYDGRSDLFSYLQGYRFRMRAKVTLDVRPHHRVEIRTLALERDEFSRAWEDRPMLVVEVVPRQAVVDVEVSPAESDQLELSQASPAPPKAAEPARPSPLAPRCESRVISFDFADARLRPEAQEVLRELAHCLPKGAFVRVVGHADQRGEGTVNMPLGHGRAQSAAGFLRGLGLISRQLELSSQGDERPVCFGDEETCHRRNRRVELSVEQE